MPCTFQTIVTPFLGSSSHRHRFYIEILYTYGSTSVIARLIHLCNRVCFAAGVEALPCHQKKKRKKEKIHPVLPTFPGLRARKCFPSMFFLSVFTAQFHNLSYQTFLGCGLRNKQRKQNKTNNLGNVLLLVLLQV